MDPATASFFGVSLITILLIFLAILISSLPLYLSVVILGGRASILKVFFTNLLVAFIAVFAVEAFGLGAFAIVILSILIYIVRLDSSVSCCRASVISCSYSRNKLAVLFAVLKWISEKKSIF
jgi:hypothetical protein